MRTFDSRPMPAYACYFLLFLPQLLREAHAAACQGTQKCDRHSSKDGYKEVQVFVDLLGRVHFNGEVYEEVSPEATDLLPDVQGHGDSSGDAARAHRSVSWTSGASSREEPANITGRRLTEQACAPPIPEDDWWPGICASVYPNEEWVETYAWVAGDGTAGSTQQQLDGPYGLFVNSAATNVYIADSLNHRIQMWVDGSKERNSNEQQTVAGETGQASNSSTQLTHLNGPRDIYVLGRCQELFIADQLNHRVIATLPNRPSEGLLIAGTGQAGSGNDQLDNPSSLHLLDDTYDLYIADTGNHRIVLWSRRTGVNDLLGIGNIGFTSAWKYASVVAGSAGQGSASNQLDSPQGVFVDPDLNVFVADTGNNRIVKWMNGASIGTVIVDSSSCSAPTAVFVDSYGMLFAACSSMHCVRSWSLKNGTTDEYEFFATWLGTCGTSGSDLKSLDNPAGVFVDIFGNVLASDLGNNRVTKRGLAALTQWSVRVAQETSFALTFEAVSFYLDLECSTRPGDETVISSEGSVALPWDPLCSSAYCQENEVLLGMRFAVAAEVRCVKVSMTFASTSTLALSVSYWAGLSYTELYVFGGIFSGEEAILRMPRFDNQQGTCLKGAVVCTLENIIGDWQADGDRIMVKNSTCAETSPANGFPQGGISAGATDGGTTFTLGQTGSGEWISATSSLEAVSYVMCWCDARRPGQSCSSASEFVTQAGTVQVIGPASEQDLDAWRGQALDIRGLSGLDFIPSDRMVVIAERSCGPNTTENLGFFEPESTSAISNASLNGLDYFWGDLSVTFVKAMVGTYQLCWCRPTSSENCNSLSHFRASAGTLLVNGPTPGQNFVCTKGLPCSVTLTGINLERGDRVMALANCGEGDAIAGFPEDSSGRKIGINTDTSNPVAFFTWGTDQVDATAGLYYVCWCSTRYTCETPDHFRAEVGIVSVYGPDLSNFVCVLGLDCAQTVSGVGLADGDRLAVVSATSSCGANAEIAEDFPGETPGISFSSSDGGSQYRWGTLTGPELSFRPVLAEYKLCWCQYDSSSGRLCTDLADFRADVGTMTAKGPQVNDPNANPPRSTGWTRGAGQQITLEIAGEALGADDRLVMVTQAGGCGLNATLAFEQFVVDTTNSTAQDARSETQNGESHQWTRSQVPNGGQFILCWCAVDCNTLENFAIYVGDISLEAPRFSEEVTNCTSGDVCEVTTTGFGLVTANSVILLSGGIPEDGQNPCLTGTPLTGVPNGAISEGNPLIVNTPGSEDTKDATFQFGTDDDPVLSTGGQYQVCWCPNNCQSQSNFGVFINEVLMKAPFAAQSYTCWNGQLCSIANLTGPGLQNGDLLRISLSCSNVVPVSGLPNSGVSQEATDAGRSFEWAALTAAGSSIFQTSSPRAYQLCWCPASRQCSSADLTAFKTEIGTMTVGGPFAAQTARCYLGYDCPIENIGGLNLRRGDRMVVKVGCTSEEIVDGSPPFEQTWNASAVNGTADGLVDLSVVNFYTPNLYTVRMDSGNYRMCWCPANAACSQVANYVIDVGLIVVGGPGGNQVGWVCTPGSLCTLGVEGGNDIVRGVGLSNGDKLMVLSINDVTQCGLPSTEALPGFPNNGISEDATSFGRAVQWNPEVATDTAPGSYTVCWCPNELVDEIGCNEGDDFNAQAGTLTIAGPYGGQLFICFVGSACQLDGMTGVALQDNDRVIIVREREGSACGQGVEVATEFSGDGDGDGMSAPAQSSGTQFYFSKLDDGGGNYSICWCAASRAAELGISCTFIEGVDNEQPIAASFLVDVGTLRIPGTPAPNFNATCVSGLPCNISGVQSSSNTIGLVDGAQIKVRPFEESVWPVPEDACDTSNVDVSLFGNGDQGVSLESTDNGQNYDWGSQALSVQGGTYLMCWRPNAESQDFQFEAGVLSIIGPKGAQTFLCTLGAACLLTGINGQGLSAGDYVRVFRTCADELATSGLSRRPMLSPTTVMWETAGFSSVTPGTYTVCWCSKLKVCQDNSDYLTSLTEEDGFVIRGPLPGQSQQCDRGFDCVIEGIAGTSLKLGDKARILVECGSDVKIGSPAVGLLADSDTGDPDNPLLTFNFSTVYERSGIYRLCWCEQAVCGSIGAAAFNFVVEIGILTLRGPFPSSDVWTITWGLQQELLLEGVQLDRAENGELRIMERCGQCNHNRPQVFDRPHAVRAYAENTTFIFNATTMQRIIPANLTGLVGEDKWETFRYCLCWCLGNRAGCNDAEEFTVEIMDVEVECDAGSEPKTVDGVTTCSLCPIGFYKESTGNVDCLPCNEGEKTAELGTRSQKQCFCEAGKYLDNVLERCVPCEENYYCLGGVDENQVAVPRALCPAGSGAWDRETCSECTGAFPAENISSCSCQIGFSPSEDGSSCVECPIGYKKGVRGNSSCILCSSIIQDATTASIGSSNCTCGPGRYMVTESSLCARCPKGYYCPDHGDAVQCPDNRATIGIGATNLSSCLCQAGWYEGDTGACVECREIEPNGDRLYKSIVSNDPCDEECPANSSIQNTGQAAIGPELCQCTDGYRQVVNEDPYSVTCVEDDGVVIIQETSRVPVVINFLTLDGVEPEVVEANLEVIKSVVYAQLGLEQPKDDETDRICIFILNYTMTLDGSECALDDWDNVTIVTDLLIRRLTSSSSSTVSTTIRVMVWSSLYNQALLIQNDFVDEDDMSGAKLLEILNRSSSDFRTVTRLYYANEQQGSGSLAYFDASCDPRQAVRPGRIFEGQRESCECKPGFEPAAERASSSFIPLRDEDINQSCIACTSATLSATTPLLYGYYKAEVSNEACTPCNEDGDETFASTDPQYEASTQEQCVCRWGEYRDGSDCRPCPKGSRCFGDATLINCTDTLLYSSTTGEGKYNQDDCVCIPGYFIDRSTLLCAPCDEGFFKTVDSNGTGNCDERCITDLGSLAYSDRGASSKLDCFCQPGSFMSPAIVTDDSDSTCRTCPSTGVLCEGGWADNTTTPKTHMPPKALQGFWIVDVEDATVETCRTVNENDESVCLGANQCFQGHEGLICGNCAELFTRDRFPLPCRPCSDFVSTSAMIFQILTELTIAVHWNEFLTISALMKSEVQKNILTVLLRMYTHWAIQVSAVLTVDLADLTPMDWSSSVAEEEAAEAVAVNVSESGEGSGVTLPWPDWHQDIMAKMLALKDTMPSIGSTQEVLECLIDMHYLGGADPPEINSNSTVQESAGRETEVQSRRKNMKLLAPATYWLCFPLLMVAWVLMFAWLQSRIFLPIFRLATGEFGNLKQIVRDQKKYYKNLILKPKSGEKKKKKDSQASFDVDTPPLSSSSSDDNNSPGQTKRKRSRGEPRAQDWEEFGTSLNQLVIQPNRFRRQEQALKKERLMDIHNDDKEEQGDYYFFLYRANVPFWSGTVVDVAPWIVVTLNNVWLPVTNRLLQLVYCETIVGFPIPRLMLRTEVECFGPEHINLAAIALTGGLVWSVGILLGIYTIISRNELQNPTIQRSFGYLLEGYEPRCWSWEVSVKKLDLLATALITYTSVASDNRSKMILYAAQAWIVITIQISYNPYDNRQVNLLDRIENLGLYVRACLFNGVALVLLIDSSAWMSWTIAIGVVTALVYFLGRIVLHASDDWVASQWVNVILAISKKRKMVERQSRSSGEHGEHHLSGDHTPGRKRPKGMKSIDKEKQKEKSKNKKPGMVDRVQALRKRSIGIMRQWLFFADYRALQLLRFTWRGPSSDAVFYCPHLLDGYDRAHSGPPGVFTEMQLWLRRWLFHLDQDAQLDFAVGTIGDFMNLLVVEARFHEIPARLTDMIMLLAASVKRLKHEMIYNPKLKKSKKGTARLSLPGEKAAQEENNNNNNNKAPVLTEAQRHEKEIEDELAEDEQYKVHGHLGQLKAMMLREVIERSQKEVNDRRKCLEELKNALQQELADRGIPVDLAWQVLDRMSTQQLQSALPYPNQLLLRIQAIATIYRCEVNAGATIQYIQKRRAMEAEERQELLRFLEYSLNHILENDAQLMWDGVSRLLDHVPVEDLRKFTKDGHICADWARKQYTMEENKNKEATDSSVTRDTVSVEDLNGMLMYVQKFPFEELQELLEYVQVLLDFLQLPNTPVWSGQQLDSSLRVSDPSPAEETDVFGSKLAALKMALADQGDDELSASDEAEPSPGPENVPSTKASTSPETNSLEDDRGGRRHADRVRALPAPDHHGSSMASSASATGSSGSGQGDAGSSRHSPTDRRGPKHDPRAWQAPGDAISAAAMARLPPTQVREGVGLNAQPASRHWRRGALYERDQQQRHRSSFEVHATARDEFLEGDIGDDDEPEPEDISIPSSEEDSPVDSPPPLPADPVDLERGPPVPSRTAANASSTAKHAAVLAKIGSAQSLHKEELTKQTERSRQYLRSATGGGAPSSRLAQPQTASQSSLPSPAVPSTASRTSPAAATPARAAPAAVKSEPPAPTRSQQSSAQLRDILMGRDPGGARRLPSSGSRDAMRRAASSAGSERSSSNGRSRRRR